MQMAKRVRDNLVMLALSHVSLALQFLLTDSVPCDPNSFCGVRLLVFSDAAELDNPKPSNDRIAFKSCCERRHRGPEMSRGVLRREAEDRCPENPMDGTKEGSRSPGRV